VGTLHTELTVRAASPEEFARLVADWLTAAREQLFPELSARLPDEPVLNPDLTDDSAAWGPPGVTWASLRVQRKPLPSGGSTALYSRRAWTRMLNGLVKAHPFDVALGMTPLGADGRPRSVGSEVTVAAHRSHAHPDWARLEVSVPSDIVPWPGSASVELGVAAFATDQAGRIGACYGHVTDDADIHATALERATRGVSIDPPAVPRCREVLRGYSWVTICAVELAARLGGVVALTASGAFSEVSELPDGQACLRATPTLEDFRGAAVRRVFEVLAPVLLTGRATEPFPGEYSWMRLVLGADAADYQ
jgi:hypothetical protein